MGCDSRADLTQHTDGAVWVVTEHGKTCDVQFSWGWAGVSDGFAQIKGSIMSGLQVSPGNELTVCSERNLTGTCKTITGRGVHELNAANPAANDHLGSISVRSLSTTNGAPYLSKTLTSQKASYSGANNPAQCCPTIGDTEVMTGSCNNGQVTCTYTTINETLNPGQLSQYFDQQTLDRWLKNTTAGGGGRCERLNIADFLGTTWSGACKTALGDDVYNLNLINKCVADTSFGWINNAQIVNSLKDIVRTSATHNDLVMSLFQTYCGGSPIDTKSLGGHRTDTRCACINASNFGITGTSNCFNDNIKNFPGCATTNYYGSSSTPHVGLYDKFGPIIRYPDKNLVNSALASFNASPGCLVEACGVGVAGANTGDLMLPATASTCPSVNMQFCGININVGAAQDSPINAQCTQTQVTNPPAGTPGASQVVGSPATTTPPADSPGGASPSTDTLWPTDKVPGLDTKNKQIGFLFFIFICFCCCCLMVVGVGVAGSGGGSAPAAPNYSANIARLGALTSSL